MSSATSAISVSRDDRFVVTANFSGFRFWPWRTGDIIDDARAWVVQQN